MASTASQDEGNLRLEEGFAVRCPNSLLNLDRLLIRVSRQAAAPCTTLATSSHHQSKNPTTKSANPTAKERQL